jgi:hypothetical protein
MTVFATDDIAPYAQDIGYNGLVNGAGYSVENRRRFKRYVGALVAAFVGAMAVIYAMHAPLITHQSDLNIDGVHRFEGATDPFDPLKCTKPPSECWDGYSKKGGFVCVTPDKPMSLRGGQVVAQPGKEFCYKSIYFNLERSTFSIVAWFLIWFMLASRGTHLLFDSIP